MVKAVLPQIDSPQAFADRFAVSRETVARLATYEALLRRWQKTINLVAPSTLEHVWHRHFADSAQVYFASLPPTGPRLLDCVERPLPRPPPYPNPLPKGKGGAGHSALEGGGKADFGPSAHPGSLSKGGEGKADAGRGRPTGPSNRAERPLSYLDIGSGAGFPGLVIAILAAEHGPTRHTFIESDSRKAAFLREAARAAGVVVDIVCARIENPQNRAKVGEVHCVTARALAPLPRLVELAYPYFGLATVGLFSKGREAAAEVEEASRLWSFEHRSIPSVTDEEGRIVLLQSLQRRNAS